MAFDYFYGRESEQYAFYRIPKLLFTNERLKGLTTDAKLLYGILLDRVPLSVKNGWVDKKGRVYIILRLRRSWKPWDVRTRKQPGCWSSWKRSAA